MEFRALRADEIECRVSIVKKNGVALLLYKDARVDQNILDEKVGQEYWQRSHQMIGDRLYCTVSIYNEKLGCWVSKQDVGTESYTEKEKGQASDSFKRACFNWGIGRELYTAPFIWIPANLCKITETNGKYNCYTRFKVDSIRIVDGKIRDLIIVDDAGNVVFETAIAEATFDTDKKITEQEAKIIRAELARTGKTEKGICEYLGIKSIEDMSASQYVSCVKLFNKAK